LHDVTGFASPGFWWQSVHAIVIIGAEVLNLWHSTHSVGGR
jgi:hypothetical protein